MSQIDAVVDEEFARVRNAANDLVHFSYHWLLDQPPSFENVADFIGHFDLIEKKLNEGGFVNDILADLSELAIGAKIPTFATETLAIRTRYMESSGAGSSLGQPSPLAPTPDRTASEIRELFSRWRKSFSVTATSSLGNLRVLPSLSSQEEVVREVLAFDIALRLKQARSGGSLPVAAIRCNDVTVTPGGKFRLKVEDFSVGSGEIVACVGPNASGKSTFLRLLSGRLQPLRGLVEFPATDRKLRLQGRTHRLWWPLRRQRIRFVEQDPVLGEMRIDKRIALSLSDVGITGDSNRALSNLIIERFRLLGLLQRSSRELSSGERKFAALACAIATFPDVLLLDEPLSSLDYFATMQFIDDISRIARSDFWGRPAIVFSSHHLDETHSCANREYFFSAGSLSLLEACGAGNLFEVVVRDAGSDLSATRAPEVSGFSLFQISGRLFLKSRVPATISEASDALRHCGYKVISVTDITTSPKRRYLGA